MSYNNSVVNGEKINERLFESFSPVPVIAGFKLNRTFTFTVHGSGQAVDSHFFERKK